MNTERTLCTVCTTCAVQVSWELSETSRELKCLDGRPRKCVCNRCGKTRQCMRYEISRRENGETP